MIRYILVNNQVKLNLISFLENLSIKPPVLCVEIKQYHKKRTLEQNSYYWGVVLKAFSESTGYTPEEMHDLLTDKFLPTNTVEFGEVKKEVPISTTKLDTLQFREYLESILRLAAEHGLYIPGPGDDTQQ